MEVPKLVQIKILGELEFIQELEVEAQSQPEAIEIIYVGKEKDPTQLAFGIEELAAFVAVVQGAVYLGELSIKIYNWLKNRKNKEKINNQEIEEEIEEKKIVVQTPLNKAEITGSEDLTVDEVRRILKKLLDK